MKKKYLAVVLAVYMGAAMVTGCGRSGQCFRPLLRAVSGRPGHGRLGMRSRRRVRTSTGGQAGISKLTAMRFSGSPTATLHH